MIINNLSKCVWLARFSINWPEIYPNNYIGQLLKTGVNERERDKMSKSSNVRFLEGLTKYREKNV